jgi:hypothetical protein
MYIVFGSRVILHVSQTRECGMSSKPDTLELCEVDNIYVCEYVFAHVGVLDVREDKRAVVLNCDRICDIHGFAELLGGSVVSERVDWAVNEITSHSMLACLDAGGYYLHLNTLLLAHISYYRCARIRIFPLSNP